MSKWMVGWTEVAGQRVYLTTAVRTALAALATGPQTRTTLYPAVRPQTAYVYLLGLCRTGLIVQIGGKGPTATYALTAQGRTVLDRLLQEH